MQKQKHRQNDSKLFTQLKGEIVNKSATLELILEEVFNIENIANIEYFADLINLFR